MSKSKEYPEYVGHFLLEFLSDKKIPVKNDQCIQRTPCQKVPKFNFQSQFFMSQII